MSVSQETYDELRIKVSVLEDLNKAYEVRVKQANDEAKELKELLESAEQRGMEYRKTTEQSIKHLYCIIDEKNATIAKLEAKK